MRSVERVTDVLRHREASRLLRDSSLAARAAHIRYVLSNEPGIRRQRVGKRFRYVNERGQIVTAPQQLSRIASLVIPPAWEDVWICRTADGHIQATGIDARGRKQYRYHAAWRTLRDRAKYTEILAFGRALPQLRQRIEADLRLKGLCKRRVLAGIVSLLQRTSIRVGNDEYATANGSYGLTTLQDRHVQVRGARMVFRFRGKGGKSHLIEVNDARLAHLVKQCRDVKGPRLFQYLSVTGRYCAVTSSDVNRYLRDATGRPFSAKEFRTWTGTLHAALHLLDCEPASTRSAAKRAIRAAVEAASSQLGNTAAICRKSYVHPGVIEAFERGSLQAELSKCLLRAARRAAPGLSHEESALLAWLARLAQAAQPMAKCA